MTNVAWVEQAIQRGSWVKLICGASNEDLASITDLCAVYAVAGVHCIDVAANEAVVLAARKGLKWARLNHGVNPWLMVSINDGKDIHFRKAYFDPRYCPLDCYRPCEKICPTQAIRQEKGVESSLCYGCGRCIPNCPFGLIKENNYELKIKHIGSLINALKPDALEIHTAPGRIETFQQILSEIMISKVPLHRIAVSCGLNKQFTSPEQLAKELWQRHSCLRSHGQRPIWQLDGQPMSGDLNPLTAKVAVKLWEKIHHLAPPGPLQLAGGTNANSIQLIPPTKGPSGIAFGGTARALLKPWLQEAQAKQKNLWEWDAGWQASIEKARTLIGPWLSRNNQ